MCVCVHVRAMSVLVRCVSVCVSVCERWERAGNESSQVCREWKNEKAYGVTCHVVIEAERVQRKGLLMGRGGVCLLLLSVRLWVLLHWPSAKPFGLPLFLATAPFGLHELMSKEVEINHHHVVRPVAKR